MREVIQSFSVPFEYPVYFGRDLLALDNDLLARTISRLEPGRRHRVQVFIDSGVLATNPGIADRVTAYFDAHGDRADLVDAPESVAGGEQAKNSSTRFFISGFGIPAIFRPYAILLKTDMWG